MEDQSELADLVAELDDKRVAIRNEIVIRRILWIGHVLIERVDPAISNGDTLQVDPFIVHQLKFARNIWDVMSGKTFSSYVEVPSLELRVLDHEIVQEVVEIISDSILTPAQLPETIDKTKASAHGLVNVHDIGVVVPGELVVLQLEWILNV